MRTTDVCPFPRTDTGTLIRAAIVSLSRLPRVTGWPRRNDADDASRRRCALRCDAISASSGRCLPVERGASCTSDVPVAHTSNASDGEMRSDSSQSQGRLTPCLVKSPTLPRPGTPPSRSPPRKRVARGPTPITRRRARRCNTTRNQVTPGLLGDPRTRSIGSAPDRALLVRLASEPADGGARSPLP